MAKIFNKNKEAAENGAAEPEEVQAPEQSAEELAIQKEINKLNSIRDILFGENMQAYQKEFDEIKDLIKSNQERTDRRIDELRTELSEKVNNLEQSLNDKLKDTENVLSSDINSLRDTKADRKALASMFMDIARQLEA